MKYDGTNLREVLEAHKLWVTSDGMADESNRADFRDADLRNANFSNAELFAADFRNANCIGTDFSHAILIRADFRNADCRCADFYSADMDGVDLTGANLYNAHMFKARLRYAQGVPYIPLACPDTGSFIGWKKAIYRYANGTLGEYVVVKLLIPEDAKRSSATDLACRASHAKVLEVQSLDGEVLLDENSKSGDCAISLIRRQFEYIVGETVIADKFSEDRYESHKGGIYFYLNRKDAEDHYMLKGKPFTTELVPVQ